MLEMVGEEKIEGRGEGEGWRRKREEDSREKVVGRGEGEQRRKEDEVRIDGYQVVK
jgi:hypothetical protein